MVTRTHRALWRPCLPHWALPDGDFERPALVASIMAGSVWMAYRPLRRR